MECNIGLLTGGGDRHYALGLAEALTAAGASLDFIGSNALSVPELLNNPRVKFLNLRGDQCPKASSRAKVQRIVKYYVRLIKYAARARPMLFHILWHNKFQCFDRTLLMLYYKSLGKKITFTAHNVNAGIRDGTDTWLNQLSLRIQYRLSDHIFVHTKKMKRELVSDFCIAESKVSVIPYGINNAVPNTNVSSAEARRQLGLRSSDKTMLFFGNIAPYKGLEYLVIAFADLAARCSDYRFIIAGRPKGCEDYWRQIQQVMARSGTGDRIIERIKYIPDEETELYFKAADVLVLPYTHIFQSGVMFLGYSFGLPVIASDVGSLREEIIEGKTGFIFKPCDPSDLAKVIGQYFESELFRNLEGRRAEIKAYANDRHSWSKVAAITMAVYSDLLQSAEDRSRAERPAQLNR
jgi:glycosyltransferase involved in cell wall biosynthesis